MSEPEGIEAAVLALLRRCYGVARGAEVALELLSEQYGKHIYAARQAEGTGATSVHAADGQVTLIDWEGAGLGPAAVDVGFVALSTDTGGIVGPVVAPDPARLEALLGGYRQYHRLGAEELERLADAIRFRTLVAACSNFANALRKGRAEEERPWYWQRYLMAEEIAERARRILEVSA